MRLCASVRKLARALALVTVGFLLGMSSASYFLSTSVEGERGDLSLHLGAPPTPVENVLTCFTREEQEIRMNIPSWLLAREFGNVTFRTSGGPTTVDRGLSQGEEDTDIYSKCVPLLD